MNPTNMLLIPVVPLMACRPGGKCSDTWPGPVIRTCRLAHGDDGRRGDILALSIDVLRKLRSTGEVAYPTTHVYTWTISGRHAMEWGSSRRRRR